MDDTTTNGKKDVDKLKNLPSDNRQNRIKSRSKLLGNISSFFNSAFSASTDESVGLNFLSETKTSSEKEEHSYPPNGPNRDLGKLPSRLLH